jgi:hypothetical protein
VKSRILLALVIVLNVALVFVSLAPSIVTYAELPPKAVACGGCSAPEVQRALAQATSIGRAQIQGLISSHLWLLVALALGSMAAAVGLFLGSMSKEKPHAP